ncbi:hypothetical protein RT97_27780 [Variovorax paradoxus]|uniref:Uncharacterized protein n=1 Tax=Variovorax paradoxus TaxID=34073 RepID=A0A0D0KWZ9_VARPD|nr:hypothetical protein RT97_27780 [Variovorax paradoxus]
MLVEKASDASQWDELESSDESHETWFDALQFGVRTLEALRVRSGVPFNFPQKLHIHHRVQFVAIL